MTTAIAAALQTVTADLAEEFEIEVPQAEVDAAIAALTADELADFAELDEELLVVALHDVVRPVFFDAAGA